MFLAVFGVTLLSRLPFLDAGYGAPDAWRVVRAARAIAGGAYEYSRMPGFPVHEFTSSLFVGLGPVGLNALTALFSALAAGFVALLVRGSGRGGALYAGLALALVPVFYTQSAQTLDTPWAVAFMTASLYCALTERPLAAGVALGLAIGCRVTSGAAALPALILLSGSAAPRVFVRRALVFGVTALALGVLCYLPVYAVYGADFFRVSSWGGYSPDARRIVAMALDGVWGKL
ncbi:MAG TPA: glycosyltransferase family 39 protein, partial [candidate division Zixibacteria bacterium]|nr:glycosyltransferase family 39 protein [candidate division Zixibacteria bacterium]